MTNDPFVSAICPTYGRPRLLENSIACFLSQDFDISRLELIILDDAGQLGSQSGRGWEVVSISRRFVSLPEKFNAIAGLCRGDIFVVWEEDDVYLKSHISSHVQAITDEGFAFSKPSRVLSTYSGEPRFEPADGRFHASIAFTRELFNRVGGWPLTKRADFDQQMIARLRSGAYGISDPFRISPQGYVFRYGSTGDYHGQQFMRSPDDETWYDRAAKTFEPLNRPLTPKFDAETADLYRKVILPG